MIFKEIKLSEALRIIGEGNPDGNLYVYDKKSIKFGSLYNYVVVEIRAHEIKNRRWFIMEGSE